MKRDMKYIMCRNGIPIEEFSNEVYPERYLLRDSASKINKHKYDCIQCGAIYDINDKDPFIPCSHDAIFIGKNICLCFEI